MNTPMEHDMETTEWNFKEKTIEVAGIAIRQYKINNTFGFIT